MHETQLVRDVDPKFDEFAELYRRNITRIYRYHMMHLGDKHAAEDLTSQTFLAALKEFPSRGTFAARVLEIAMEKGRKDPRWNRRESPDDALFYYQVASLPGDRAAMQRMEMESMSRTLKQISSARAEAIILYFFCELPYSEISVVLRKSTDTIEEFLLGGLKDLRAFTSPASDEKTTTDTLENKELINKLNNLAAYIQPDPFFVSELELTLATSYQPKKKWAFPLPDLSTVIGWAALVGLTFFLLYWRVTPDTSTTRKATTHPPTQDVMKPETIKGTATVAQPAASPTATEILLQNYIVQSGDTCTYIADKFGVTIDILITLNHLNSTCDILAEQTLKIPSAPISTPSSP